ncbi:MAG TPA: MFS transporter [Polyangia bacterium]|jgi:EmrB/QacA subfamily drug resistance transporter
MTRAQRLVIQASILGSFVAFLDASVVNVALPAIQRDLGGGISAQQWIVDAYLVTLGSFILLAGSLSDLFGRKRVFAAGLIGFGATSLLAAVAPGPTVLIIARGLQGVTGALLVPSSLAMIVANFTGADQGKAIGTWTAWTGIGFIVGPLLGGALVDVSSWRWVFAINVAPIAATLAVLARIPPEPARSEGSHVDLPGAILCALGLGGVIFALIEAPTHGWRAPAIALPLAGGAAAFAGFLLYERRAAHPMLDFKLFRNRNFAMGNAATLAIYAGLSAFTFLLAVFLQQVAGYRATLAGLALLPVTILMFALSPVAGRLAGKHGPRWFMTFGPLLGAAGFLLMLRMSAHTAYLTEMLPGLLVFGVGLSLTVSPLTAAILGGIDQRQAGIGSAINNAIARVAGLLAVAAIGAFIAARFATGLDDAARAASLGAPARTFVAEARARPLDTAVPARLDHDRPRVKAMLETASVGALDAGLWAMAGMLVAGGLISAAGIRNPKRQ